VAYAECTWENFMLVLGMVEYQELLAAIGNSNNIIDKLNVYVIRKRLKIIKN
jgi:hypothetical protein